ncbi:MAG TPA: hypothetical protein DCM38_03740 [Gammaproteobacteria bacterium]|nr:hypothetical protein [Gammaproteobacteria bacterium]
MTDLSRKFVCNIKGLLIGALTALFLCQGAVQAHVPDSKQGGNWQPMPPYLLVGMEIRVNFNEEGACQLLIVNGKNEECSKLSEFLKQAYENNGLIIFDGHSTQWIPYRLRWW